MFKVKLVLDEAKIMKNNKYSVQQCRDILKGIMSVERMKAETSDLYVMDVNRNSLGARLTLLGRLKKSEMLYYLKEWKNYDDEDNENGELEESDMLKLLRDKGELCQN